MISWFYFFAFTCNLYGYIKAATRGHGPAQATYARWLAEHICVPQDLEQAAVWARRAVANGQLDAALTLGRLYMAGVRGDEVPDPVEAIKWFRICAEGGNVDAQMELALVFEGSPCVRDVVVKDLAAAARLWRMVADAGNLAGLLAMGSRYMTGEDGVPKDMQQAFMFCHQAAMQGNAVGQILVAKLYNSNLGGTGSFGLQKCKTLAASWAMRSAHQGLAEAVEFLARKKKGGQEAANVAGNAIKSITPSRSVERVLNTVLDGDTISWRYATFAVETRSRRRTGSGRLHSRGTSTASGWGVFSY